MLLGVRLKMKKLFYIVVFSILMFDPFIVKSAENDLTFINSQEQFNAALQNENIKGIAIRAEFYYSVESVVRVKLDEFVKKTLTNNQLHPVFIYGLTIKKETLNVWFGDVVFECNGLIMAGVFPSVVILGNLLQATVPICGGIDEQSFRNWLADTWYSEKKYIESQGIATPK